MKERFESSLRDNQKQNCQPHVAVSWPSCKYSSGGKEDDPFRGMAESLCLEPPAPSLWLGFWNSVTSAYRIMIFIIQKLVCSLWVCAQLCLTLCDPKECSPPGSLLCGIFRARILEQVAISYSRGSSWLRDQTQCLWHFLHWQADSLPLVLPWKPIP